MCRGLHLVCRGYRCFVALGSCTPSWWCSCHSGTRSSCSSGPQKGCRIGQLLTIRQGGLRQRFKIALCLLILPIFPSTSTRFLNFAKRRLSWIHIYGLLLLERTHLLNNLFSQSIKITLCTLLCRTIKCNFYITTNMHSIYMILFIIIKASVLKIYKWKNYNYYYHFLSK